MARALSKQLFEAIRDEFAASYKRGEKHGGPSLPSNHADGDEIQKLLFFGYDSAGSHTGGYKSWGSSSHFMAALQEAVAKVIFEALAIEPCHVTGMHSPNHFVEKRPGEGGYICEIQQTQALKNFIEGLDTEREKPKFTPARDLPRRLHGGECCHRVPSQEEYRRQHRKAYVWANEIPPAELLERGT